MRSRMSEVYMLPVNVTEITQGAEVVPSKLRYKNVDELMAELNQTVNGVNGRNCANSIDLTNLKFDAVAAIELGATLKNGNTKVANRTAYGVYSSSLDGAAGVRVEKLGTATYTGGAVAAPKASHVEAASVAFADTGVLLSRVGKAPSTIQGNGARVIIYDRGHMLHMVVVDWVGASNQADAIAGTVDRWN